MSKLNAYQSEAPPALETLHISHRRVRRLQLIILQYAAELHKGSNFLKLSNLWMRSVDKCSFQKGLHDVDKTISGARFTGSMRISTDAIRCHV